MRSTMTPALPPSSRTTFFLPARAFIRQPTAGLPGEGQELEPLVLDHPVAELAAHRQDAHGAGRQPGLGHDLADGEHRQRVLRRRLEDDRAAGRDRRRELVGGQVEREVERADRGHRPDRERPGDPEPALRRRQQVERDRLAGHPLRLLGAEPEGQDGAVDLDERVPDRLARLEADEPAELLASGGDPGADLAQGAATLVGGKPAGLGEGRDRGRRPPRRTALAWRGRCSRPGSPGRPGWRRPAGPASRPSGRRGGSGAEWSGWRWPCVALQSGGPAAGATAGRPDRGVSGP